MPLPSGGHSASEQPFKRRILEGGYFPVHTALVRKRVLDAVGPFDAQLTSLEDWDLWLRVSFLFHMGNLPDLLARYRVSSGSMSTNAERMHRNRLAILTKYFNAPDGAPESWPAAKRYAFAFAYRISAVAFAQQQELARSEHLWKLSVATWPPILERLDTLYEHLCGDQPRDSRGRADSLDISGNAARTGRWLDEIFETQQELCSSESLRRSAFGNYYLAQAMLYDQSGDWSRARSCLRDAIRANPALLRDASVLRRLAKLSAGERLLGRVGQRASRRSDSEPASGQS
jgi:tetratricopeptide (TPR) repeat protein